jgi:hypothetical protein
MYDTRPRALFFVARDDAPNAECAELAARAGVRDQQWAGLDAQPQCLDLEFHRVLSIEVAPSDLFGVLAGEHRVKASEIATAFASAADALGAECAMLAMRGHQREGEWLERIYPAVTAADARALVDESPALLFLTAWWVTKLDTSARDTFTTEKGIVVYGGAGAKEWAGKR